LIDWLIAPVVQYLSSDSPAEQRSFKR